MTNWEHAQLPPADWPSRCVRSDYGPDQHDTRTQAKSTIATFVTATEASRILALLHATNTDGR